MKYLLSDYNIEQLRSFCKKGPVLFAFDLDGTLAKIEKRPCDVKIANNLIPLLLKLQDETTLAIISGRKLSDIKKILPFKTKHIVGNHGLEGLNTNETKIKMIEKICQKWEKSLNKIIDNPKKKMFVENKGYSISVHYRLCKNKKKIKQVILKTCSLLSPKPFIMQGKQVIDLIHPDSSNKGDAIIKLIEVTKAKKVFYLGDDRTDENVFTLPNKYKIFKTRVGYSKKSKANFYIKRQSEILPLLKLLTTTLALRRGSATSHHRKINK